MLYLVISSLLFALTLFVPDISLCTMTTFLMPLYHLKNKQLFLQGYLWGLIVFGSYWYWIIILFKNQSLFYMGIILWIIITAWCSLFSGVWIYFFKRWSIISTIMFFMLVTQAILLLLGDWQGIPFINPLVLLSQYSFILRPVYYLKDIGMLIIIFGIQNLVAQQTSKIKFLYFGLLIFLTSSSLIQQKHKNYSMDDVAVVTPWWYNQKKGAMFDGYRLAHDLCEAAQQKNIKLIITPESTFCFDVAAYQSFISIWCDSANDVPILLGTHVKKDGFPHNALLLLHNKKIMHSYFKQHKMPFLEKSLWFEYILGKPILSSEFIPKIQDIMLQNDLWCFHKKMYQLFMCSEFFMETKKVWGYPIILVWNDSWLSCNYMKRLAYLFINYFEMKHHVKVYHVATSGVTNINN